MGTIVPKFHLKSGDWAPGIPIVSDRERGKMILGSALASNKLIYRPLSVTALGDSLTAYNSPQETPSNLTTNSNKRFSGRSWLARGSMRSSGAWFPFEYVFGVSGYTSAQVLATCLPALLSNPFYVPDVCVVLAGTNDIAGAVPQATTIANLNSMYDQLERVSIQPIAALIPPLNSQPNLSYKLNLAIARNARALGIPCVDFYTPCVNAATGNWIAAYTADNIHMNPFGAEVMGYALNQTILSAFGLTKTLTPVIINDSGNAYTNQYPDMDLWTGFQAINTAGSFPLDWAVGVQAMSTLYNSSGAEPGGGHTMRAATPPIPGIPPNYLGNAWCVTGNGTNGYRSFSSAFPTFTPGDRLALSFRVKFLNPAIAPSTASDFAVGIVDSNTGNQLAGVYGCFWDALDITQPQLGGDPAYNCGVFYQEYTTGSWNSGQVPLGLFQLTNVAEGTPNAGDSLTIANFQIVNLTALGIL